MSKIQQFMCVQHTQQFQKLNCFYWKMGAQVHQPTYGQITRQQHLSLQPIQVHHQAVHPHQIIQALTTVSLPSTSSERDDIFMKQLMGKNINTVNSTQKQSLILPLPTKTCRKSHIINSKKPDEKKLQSSILNQEVNKQNEISIPVNISDPRNTHYMCKIQDWEDETG